MSADDDLIRLYSQRILALSVPQKTKRTEMIGGSPAEIATELLRKLRDERRVL